MPTSTTLPTPTTLTTTTTEAEHRPALPACPMRSAQPERPSRPCQRDLGQATTEYALVLLAAALVGLLVIAWATAGGGAARVARLFNQVIDAVIDKV